MSTWLVGASLAGALLAAPAQADGSADQISGLVGGLAGSSSSQGSSSSNSSTRASDYGHTHAPNARLRAGCHNYRYRYVVTAPTHDWTLETFLRGPRGGGAASGAFFSDSDPETKRAHFRLCRWSTRPGRFTIRAKLVWYDDNGNGHTVWLKPSHFRLRRR